MHILKRTLALLLVTMLIALSPPLASAETTSVQMEEMMVPSQDPGVSLYVRNKHPVGITQFSSNKILLYVHGATYPAETTFDLPLGGLSWMDFIAQRGYDVYLVDVRGYGRSTRPPQMDRPPEDNPPLVRTETAVKDVSTAIEFILKRRNVSKINLMGWSWGTTIMGAYTAQHNEKVDKLVLYALQWIGETSSAGNEPRVGAYRSVTMESVKTRWLDGVPDKQRRDLIPHGWFEMLRAALLASDPAGAKQSPPVVRAPNGVIQDSAEYWRAGKALYDPADIHVPTLIVHADLDADLPTSLDQKYFTLLINAPYKRFVEIGDGTHFVIMEKNRMELIKEVQVFLDDSFTPEK